MKRPSQSQSSGISSVIFCSGTLPIRTSRPSALASYRLKKLPLTLTLSRRGRGNDIKFLKRTYSPIDLLTYSLKKKHVAFTLAETLITLGVIGVVAAIVLPNFIYKYQFEVLDKRIKKTYAVVSDALIKMGYDEGDENLAKTYSDTQPGGGYKSMEHFYKYFSNIKKEKKSTLYGGELMSRYLWVLPDGSAISQFASWNRNYILIDANGSNLPNIIGYDAMFFEVKKGNLLSFPDELWFADCDFPLVFDGPTDNNAQFCLPRYYLYDKCYNDENKRYKDCLPGK